MLVKWIAFFLTFLKYFNVWLNKHLVPHTCDMLSSVVFSHNYTHSLKLRQVAVFYRLAVTCTLKPSALCSSILMSVGTSYTVNGSLTCDDFVTLCIGHLINTGSLNWAGLPDVTFITFVMTTNLIRKAFRYLRLSLWCGYKSSTILIFSWKLEFSTWQ